MGRELSAELPIPDVSDDAVSGYPRMQERDPERPARYYARCECRPSTRAGAASERRRANFRAPAASSMSGAHAFRPGYATFGPDDATSRERALQEDALAADGWLVAALSDHDAEGLLRAL